MKIWISFILLFVGCDLQLPNLVTDGTANLTWDAPVDADPLTYNVRVDEETAINTTETSFIFTNLAVGEHTFSVTAVDPAGNESEPVFGNKTISN